jgi:hypothetical protein
LIEARREDAYYVAHLAREGTVPNVPADVCERLIAAGGLIGDDEAAVAAREAAGDHDQPDPIEPDDHDGDPHRPRPGVLACGHDPANDPCRHRDVDPAD